MNVIHYILFILFFLIIYSVSFKTVEGNDENFYYYNKLIDYNTMPNSFVNDATPSRTVNKFGFYKGKGTFKKGYTKETKSDEKISTLNKLLNRLLGKIESDNQDCVGSYGKYSECDKSCGSNAFQTRKYNITQERGKNGKDCPFVDEYEEQKRCNLDLCQLGDICKNNDDCGTGNCNPNSTRCENMVPCDINNYNVCNETDCIKLNDEYDNDVMREGTFIYNNVDDQCFFKTPAEIEKLNLNVFTFNYRTVSEQVENLALDCDYFQVKKDGVGPCVNASNVIIKEGVPECLPGYGPEPTMFNESHACMECIIPPDQKFNSQESETPTNGDDEGGDDTESKNCYCDNGGTFNNVSMACGPGRSGTTATLCENTSDPLWFLKKKEDPANPDNTTCIPACDNDRQQVRKSGPYVSCMTCPVNSQPYRSYCNGIGSGSIDCNLSNYSKYLSVDSSDSISEDTLKQNNYHEKCIDTTVVGTGVCLDGQSKVGENCVCTGEGMNNKPPGCPPGAPDSCEASSNCNTQTNCLPGYFWGLPLGGSDSWSGTENFVGNKCNQCADATNAIDTKGVTNCLSSIPNTCATLGGGTLSPYQECSQCKRGWQLLNGACTTCAEGYLNVDNDCIADCETGSSHGFDPDAAWCYSCDDPVGCQTPGEQCLKDVTDSDSWDLVCEVCHDPEYQLIDRVCQCASGYIRDSTTKECKRDCVCRREGRPGAGGGMICREGSESNGRQLLDDNQMSHCLHYSTQGYR